jgi:hypothetical protein
MLFANNCNPLHQLCSQSYAQPIASTNTTQAATALHLEVSDVQGLDDPVDWALTCHGDAEGCRVILAKGTDPLPITIDVPNLHLQPSVTFYLQVTPPSVAPLVDAGLSVAHGPAQVTGQIKANLVPVVLPDTIAYLPPVQVAVSLDGSTGPCVPRVECPALVIGPGYSYLDSSDYKGLITALNLTLSWTPTAAPLDSALRLLAGSYKYCDCAPVQVATGTSPLALQSVGLVFRDGLDLQVGVPDNTGLYGTVSPTEYRTAYHLEGTVTVQHPAATQTGDDGT